MKIPNAKTGRRFRSIKATTARPAGTTHSQWISGILKTADGIRP